MTTTRDAAIPTSLFKTIADEIVPRLRATLDEMGFAPGDVSPSIAMTATVDVDGLPARVRVDVTLDPDEEVTP